MADRPAVDFDLHGYVGVRVLDATPGDVAVITRQLGPLQRRLEREPDITVRFVPDIDDDGPLTYAGWLDAGATERGFYLLRGRAGVQARTALPFAAVGGRCDIVCERRVGPVPHLLAIVNFTALAHGVLPLHASAFNYRGRGVLATGWAKGGKTETLLAFARKGAHYIGDEWVYLTSDGTMHGVPEPIRLWQWHLRQFDDRAARWGRSTRTRLATLDAIARRGARLAAVLPERGVPASVLRRATPLVARQAYVQVPPAELFGESAIDTVGQLDTVLFATSSTARTVTVRPVDPTEVARRMVSSLVDERSPFMAHYRQFRFLQPDQTSGVVESAASREAALMSRVMAGREAYVVDHPYPMQIESLAAALEAVLHQR